MSKQFMFRQGDVMIVSCDAIPADLTPVERDNGRIVLAYGEVTGHAHAILDSEAMLLQGADLETRFLNVLAEGGVKLVHEEHSTVDIPAGTYRVIRQREYDLASGAVRQVAD